MGTLWTPRDRVALGIAGPILRANSLADQLWTPEQGSSGLLVVPNPPPLLVVRGTNIYERRTVSGSENNEVRYDREGNARMSGSGLVVISNKSRTAAPKRIVGHPDLASGISVVRGDVLYVSVSEAIFRERRGESVEIHLIPSAEDEANLGDVRARVRARWANDSLPDGWTRTPWKLDKQDELPEREDDTTLKDKHDSLPMELRELARRFATDRSRTTSTDDAE